MKEDHSRFTSYPIETDKATFKSISAAFDDKNITIAIKKKADLKSRESRFGKTTNLTGVTPDTAVFTPTGIYQPSHKRNTATAGSMGQMGYETF